MVVPAALSSFLGRPRPFLPAVGSPSAPPVAAAAAFLGAGPLVFFAAAGVDAAAPGTFFGRPRPTLAFLGGSSSASSSAARFTPPAGIALGASIVSSGGSSLSTSRGTSVVMLFSPEFSGASVDGLAPLAGTDPVLRKTSGG